MTVSGWLEILIFIAALTALTPVLGGYMARVFRGEFAPLARVERVFYRAIGVDPARGQDWKGYARSVLIFSALFGVLLYGILRTQGIHPWNPRDLSSGTWDVSFNTTSSFLANTNWQFYGGETTLSYFSQMAGLAVQNFVSGAVGIAVLVAFVRALASRSGKEIGVFYVDFTRAVLYVLVPLSVIVGLVLVSQGVLQTLSGTTDATGLTGLTQTFSFGPVAGQEAIKMLGTNGGGFFNVNSAMPFENPTRRRAGLPRDGAAGAPARRPGRALVRRGVLRVRGDRAARRAGGGAGGRPHRARAQRAPRAAPADGRRSRRHAHRGRGGRRRPPRWLRRRRHRMAAAERARRGARRAAGP
jgi:K+-transporting ATPase A subunit